MRDARSATVTARRRRRELTERAGGGAGGGGGHELDELGELHLTARVAVHLGHPSSALLGVAGMPRRNASRSPRASMAPLPSSSSMVKHAARSARSSRECTRVSPCRAGNRDAAPEVATVAPRGVVPVIIGIARTSVDGYRGPGRGPGALATPRVRCATVANAKGDRNAARVATRGVRRPNTPH